MLTRQKYLDQVTELNRLGKLYAKGSQEIPDTIYDRMYDELVAYETEHPDSISKNSPSQKVDSDLKSGFKKVLHVHPMLSIMKLYEFSELKKWIEATNEKIGYEAEYVAEYKIDGASLSLIYEKGKLIRAVTRGDGAQGDEVTANAMTVESIPKQLVENVDCEIRGEIIIFDYDFGKINNDLRKRGEKLYENSRNLASGSLKLKDSKECATRKLNFVAYSIIDDRKMKTHRSDINLLQRYGFKYVPDITTSEDADELIAFCQKTEKSRDKLPYGLDGIVVKCNDKDMWPKLGGTSRCPHYLRAYKFKAEIGIATITAVEHRVGRTGAITPVAILGAGVRLAGTTVVQATLHNYDECNRLGVSIGDEVEVEKRGEIIPKIMRLHKKISTQAKITPPWNCPVCKGPITRINDEVIHKCRNEDCPAKTIGKFVKFASKSAMNMRGISEATLEQLLDANLVTTVDDLYSLTEDDIVNLDRYGTSKASNVISAIQSSKNAGLKRLLIGLGLPSCGEGTSKELSDHFTDMNSLMNASVNDLQQVPGIKEVAHTIYGWFHDKENIKLVESLKSHGVKMKEEKLKSNTGSSKLAGMTFVITGTLTRKRDEFVVDIETNGGKVSGSVSKSTSFLLAGDDCGSKLTKAEQLGVKVIEESEFLAMIE